jgi:hypothetical protein
MDEMNIVTRRGFPGVIDASGEWAPIGIQGGADEDDDMNRYIDFLNRYSQTEFGRAQLDQISSSAGFEDKKLDQAWKIAQAGESGANSRASMSAGASRYAADASKAAAGISAKASMYGADRSLEGTKYSTDIGRLTDQERIALDRQLGLGGLGVDLVKTASTLTGPEDIFSYVDLLRGGRMMGGAPYFLGGLMGTQPQVADFGAPSGTPTPMTMDSILRGLGSATNGGSMSDGSAVTDMERNADAFKQNLSGLLGGGMHQLTPGSLERLNPSELGLLQGAAGKLGYRWDDLVSTYRRAAPNQGNPLAA